VELLTVPALGAEIADVFSAIGPPAIAGNFSESMFFRQNALTCKRDVCVKPCAT
jgi:hypothetical protein